MLDDGKAFTIHRGDLSFNLSSDNVFAYGEVDFHKGTEDYENIDSLIPYRDMVHLPLHYDYDTHTCKQKQNVIKLMKLIILELWLNMRTEDLVNQKSCNI